MMLLSQVTVLLLALDFLVVRCSLQSLEKLLKLLSRRRRTIKLGLKRLRQMLVSRNLFNYMPWSFALNSSSFMFAWNKRVKMNVFVCAGSPLNSATPAGTCRYDSSLGITLHLRFLLLDLSNITLSIVMLAVTYILLIVVQGFWQKSSLTCSSRLQMAF